MSPPAGGGAYDDDDFVDQYDEDLVEEGQEELSPEDKASMDAGTADVRKALGDDANKVTLKQIQDALWHYYYEVDKSVAYLNKTFISPPPKPAPTPKKTPDGESETFSFSTTAGRPASFLGAGDKTFEHGRGLGCAVESFPPSDRFPVTGWPGVRSQALDFGDMPWLNIPKERQTIFIPPRRLPGGLLGGGDGAPKMSKLQALAAARKKKNDEKKGQEKTAQVEKGIKRLSVSDGLNKENARPGPHQTKYQKLSEEPRTTSTSPDAPGTDRLQPTPDGPSQKTQDALRLDDAPGDEEMDQDTPAIEEIAVHKAAPSLFAQTLLGPASKQSTTAIEDEHTDLFFFKKSAPCDHVQTVFSPVPIRKRDAEEGTGASAVKPAARQRRDSDRIAFPYTHSPSFDPSAFSQPSPDDVVLAAQAKAGKKTPSTSKAKKADKGDGASKKGEVTNGMSNLKVADVPPPKSKGLDVVKEFENSTSKRSTSFVVVGHVDAGKSTLMGRLLLELKFVEERTVEKYRRQAEKSGKQSFALAWVMDQRSEERDRGVTIDIATNHFETETTKFTILDAPGHRDFVPNMIAGASQADFAILVIDANTGAYEKGLKGQTREHVLLLRSLGVQRLIVAVNKLDMVGWSQDRFDEISQQVTGFLTGLGFQGKHISFVPISGLSGGNIAAKVEDPAASWYQGTTLMDALEASGPSTARALKKPLRMAVSEVFRSQQGTTTLSGRVDSGTMQIGDVVFVQPSGETAYIKSIMVDTDAQEWAVAGQNISIALTDIDPVHIRVGDIICHTTDPIECGDTFTMKAMAFEHLMPMAVDLHRGRLHAAGQIQSLVASLDKATGDIIKKKPKVVQPGGVARVVIKLGAKVPLERGQRVVIRSGGETVAAGLLE